jgi:hypothetical protein
VTYQTLPETAPFGVFGVILEYGRFSKDPQPTIPTPAKIETARSLGRRHFILWPRELHRLNFRRDSRIEVTPSASDDFVQLTADLHSYDVRRFESQDHLPCSRRAGIGFSNPDLFLPCCNNDTRNSTKACNNQELLLFGAG